MVLLIHLISYKIPGKDIPPQWANSVKLWEDMNPHANIILWTTKEIDRLVDELSPEYRIAYDGFEYWIQKFDFIRLIIVLKYGGVYSDLDVIPKKPFYFVEEYKMPFFCSFMHSDEQNSLLYYNNSLFFSPKNHPLITELIESLIVNQKTKVGTQYRTKTLRVLNSTGPFALTSVLLNTKHPYITLPRGLINSCYMNDEYPCSGPDAIVTHLEGRSWLGVEDKLFYHFFENARMKDALIILGVILLGLLIWVSIIIG